MSALADEIVRGNVQAVARLISGLENRLPSAFDELDVLSRHTGRAHVVGITGSPGIGKSTMTSALVRIFRDQGLTVGVLAVDPSSPFSGGAILGDRIRMQQHAGDEGVFIRSIGSRGSIGGLARVVASSVQVVDAMRKDVILVETVGAGQSDIDIHTLAHTTVLLVSGDSGDAIQVMKAGIMEVADVFVVNRADKGGAEAMANEIELMLAMKRSVAGAWKPPVIVTEATRGRGVEDVASHILAHRTHLSTGGLLDQHQRQVARQELISRAVDLFTTYLSTETRAGGKLAGVVDDVGEHRLGAGAAAQRIVTLFARDMATAAE